MIVAAIIGYILLGLFAARRIFVWRVKRDLYDRTYDETGTVMFAGACFWPVIPVLAACYYTGKLLTANPPESNRVKERRIQTERYAMEERIRELERELLT